MPGPHHTAPGFDEFDGPGGDDDFDSGSLPARAEVTEPRVSTDPKALLETLSIADKTLGAASGITAESPHDMIVKSIVDRAMTAFSLIKHELSTFQTTEPRNRWEDRRTVTSPEVAEKLYVMGVYAFDRGGSRQSERRFDTALLSYMGRPHSRWSHDDSEPYVRSLDEIRAPRHLGDFKSEIVVRYLLGAESNRSMDLGGEIRAQRILATIEAIPEVANAVSKGHEAKDYLHVIKNPFVSPEVRDVAAAMLHEILKKEWSEQDDARLRRIGDAREKALVTLRKLETEFEGKAGEIDRPTDSQQLQDAIFDDVCRSALFFSALGWYDYTRSRDSRDSALSSIRGKIRDWIMYPNSETFVSFLIEQNLWEPGFSKQYVHVYGRSLVLASSHTLNNESSFPKKWIEPVATRCGTNAPSFKYIQYPWGTGILADWEPIMD